MQRINELGPINWTVFTPCQRLHDLCKHWELNVAGNKVCTLHWSKQNAMPGKQWPVDWGSIANKPDPLHIYIRKKKCSSFWYKLNTFFKYICIKPLRRHCFFKGLGSLFRSQTPMIKYPYFLFPFSI